MIEQALHLSSVIGFGGEVQDGLLIHPSGEDVIFPLGSTIVMRKRDDPGSQKFFRGHTDMVRTT
jgi:cilia- and flagella-associated protein 52